MSFFQKVGIALKFWDFKRAPAISFLVLLVLALIGGAFGYVVWSIFSG